MMIKVNFIDNDKGIEILASALVTGKEIIQANKKTMIAISINTLNMIMNAAADINIISQLDRATQNNPNIIRAIVESSSPDFRLSEVWQAYAE